MFEKEAEEWWNNEYSPSLYDNVSEVWQDGAEFGYNKVMADNYSKMEQKFYDNLTKAKEIIENLLYYVKQCTCERSNYAEIEEDIKEAEQFIKEIK